MFGFDVCVVFFVDFYKVIDRSILGYIYIVLFSSRVQMEINQFLSRDINDKYKVELFFVVIVLEMGYFNWRSKTWVY